jgi:hypothetical protein
MIQVTFTFSSEQGLLIQRNSISDEFRRFCSIWHMFPIASLIFWACFSCHGFFLPLQLLYVKGLPLRPTPKCLLLLLGNSLHQTWCPVGGERFHPRQINFYRFRRLTLKVSKCEVKREEVRVHSHLVSRETPIKLEIN